MLFFKYCELHQILAQKFNCSLLYSLRIVQNSRILNSMHIFQFFTSISDSVWRRVYVFAIYVTCWHVDGLGGLNERAKILTHVTPYSAAAWGRGLGVKKRYNGFPPIFHREAGLGALLSASQAKVTMLTGNLGACEKRLTTGR